MGSCETDASLQDSLGVSCSHRAKFQDLVSIPP